jgi:GNAT superfamily N-acetyltransferase
MEPEDVNVARALMVHLGYRLTTDQMRGRLYFVNHSTIDWLFVAERDGHVMGLLGLRLREHIEDPTRHMEISVIVTASGSRRSGIGRAMLEFAESFARDHDCTGMFLVSGLKRRDEAHRFYRKLGYEATGYRFVKTFEE